MRDAAELMRRVDLRIQHFCDWFDVPPPKLKREGIDIYLTTELLDWFKEYGASMDWIVAGDVKPMAEAYRREQALRLAREEIDEEMKDVDLN